MRTTIIATASVLALMAGVSRGAPIGSYPPATVPLSGAETLLGRQGSNVVVITPSQLSGYTLGPPSPTTNWYQDQSGVTIRTNDRFMAGGASANSQTSTAHANDWLSSLIVATGGSARNPVGPAQAAIVTNNSPNAALALTTGIQSLTNNGPNGNIGTGSWCINNSATYATGCWAGYDEVWLTTTQAGAAFTQGREIDVAVFPPATAPSTTPFGVGNTIGLQMAAGGGYAGATVNPSVAINLQNNPSKWQSGINFVSGSLLANGAGYENAINLYNGNAIQQWMDGANIGSGIIFNVTDSTKSTRIFLNNGGMSYTTGGGSTLMNADPVGRVGAVVFGGLHTVTSITPGSASVIGTGGTIACGSGVHCDSVSGDLALTTGTGSLSQGQMVSITFADTRLNVPTCVVELYGGTGTFPNLTKVTSATSLAISVGSVLTTSTNYSIDYICSGT
jgi:hypothetical protein